MNAVSFLQGPTITGLIMGGNRYCGSPSCSGDGNQIAAVSIIPLGQIESARLLQLGWHREPSHTLFLTQLKIQAKLDL